MRKKILILFLLLSGIAKAQLIVNNTVKTPAQLVQDVLIGNGVVPTNIQFNRSAAAANAVRDQAAEFSTNFNATNLGLNAGILLATGNAQIAIGPNDTASKSAATMTPTMGDADLAQLSGQSINNVAILEFDFVATGLILNFDYVFASEEYPEYTNSAYNDTFGFFLSGMGLNGPYSNNAVNIALTPTTNTGSNVVSIFNVNNGTTNSGPCKNCTYYVSNGTGTSPIANPSIQYDGFTVPLRATSALVCGETYHIKLAIANVSDDLYDSGVFIKNFRIQPLELLDNLGLNNNLGVCYGEVVTIYSGITPSANTLKWYKDGVFLPAETNPNLTVTQSGVYTLEEYTPSGCRLAVDDITITYRLEIPSTPPLDLTLCTSSAGPYEFNIDQTTRIASTINTTDYIFTYYDTNANLEAYYGLSAGVIQDTDLASYFISSNTATIYVRIEEVSTGCVSVKSFDLNVTPPPSGTISFAASPYCNNSLASQSITSTGLTSGGTYSVLPSGLIINATTGAITPFGSTVDDYVVTYSIPATADCPAFSVSTPVSIEDCDCTVTASPAVSQTVCIGTAIVPISYTSSTIATTGSVPAADLPPGVTGSFSGDTYTISGTPTAAGNYTFTVTLQTGITDTCVLSTTIDVKALPTATISGTTTICANTTTPITFTGTPNATVTYTVDGGLSQTILLDATGNATLTTPTLALNSRYDIVNVTTSGTPGCSQVLSGSAIITVKALPTASISGTTTICSGATSVITFSGTPNATVTYTIDSGSNITIPLDASGTATITTPLLTLDSTYNLVSVASNGTPNCSQLQTGSATITVKALPTATISGTTTICENTTATITFTGTPDAVVTYNIDGAPNVTVLLDATGTATVTTPILTSGTSTYNLVSIVTSNGLPNCTQNLSGSAVITVKALPTATISGTTTICENTTAVITFTGTPNATITYTVDTVSQTITLDATGNATLTTPSLTTNSVYDLVSVTTNGTPDCAQNQIGSVTITVKALPTATISGTTTICSGATTVIAFNGTPNATVTYSIGTNPNTTILLDAAGNASITTAALTADTTYNLESVASGGVPNCSQTLTGSAVVTIKAIPTATISGTTTICENTTATITFTGTPNATVTYTVDAVTDQVTLDASGNATVTTPSLTASSTYTLVGIDSNGIPNCSQSLTGSVVISTSALPTATISGTTTICENTTAVITFGGTANATITYKVDLGADQTITLDATGAATLTTPILTANSTYDLVSVALNGASNCSQNQTGSVTITVKALPTATISGTTTICSGTTTVITFTGTPNATVTYTVDSGANQTITLDATGNRTRTVGLSLDAGSTYTYDLVSVASNGTPNCSQPISGSAIITVKALPDDARVDMSSGPNVVCSGSAATIIFSGPPNATVTYTVDNGPNETITLDATGSATLTTPILTAHIGYYLESVETNGIPNCSKLLHGALEIGVKALPTASISGTTTVCANATTTIIFGGTPNATITYTVDAGTDQTITLDATGVATLTTPSLTTNSTYSLVSVTSNGIPFYTPNCSQNQTGTAIVTVNQLPTASISGDTICSGTAGTVTFTGTPNATVTYIIGSGTNQNIMLDAAGVATLTTSVLTADSTYNLVSVAATGVSNCSQPLTGSALVRVLPLPTATISGTTQLCLNSAAPQITFTGANGQSPYTFTYSLNNGFPQTISTALGSDSVTLNAATSAAGPFVYDLIAVSSATTPSCNQPQVGSAIVTILELPTATIAVSNAQVCINDPLVPQITFTGTNGQSPYTFTYKVNNGPIQTAISTSGNNSTTVNVLTTVAGTFVYDLVSVSSSTTPSCSQPQVGSATVVVKPASTLTTTSATVQSVCASTPITPIVLNIGGSATGATVTVLPTGLSGVLNAGGTTFTISGSPSQTGSFNYTVTTTGGCSPAAVVMGTITVKPNATIALSSPVGSNVQTLCINNNVGQIQYTIGSGAASASITSGGLPLGVNAIFSSGVLTISGTALEAGTFNYVVSTIAGCGVASLSGVITVKPEVNLTLTSAPITTMQTACMNVLITPIKYSVTNGATGASVSGLPTGITGVYNGGVFTISGSTSQIGPFSYVVTTVGGCGSATQNGTITINPNVTIALTSAPTTTLQTLCIDNPITPITYEVNNGATGASLVSGTVPDGIQGSFNQITKVFTISGIAIESGNFIYIISTTGGCGVATLTGTIRVNPIPVVGLPQDGFICVDVAGVPTTQYVLGTNLQPSVYGFEWSDINGVLAGETGNSYTASAPGYYSVKVTNLATQCTSSAGATIVPSLPPSQVFTSVTSYFEDNQMATISVTPPGNYLYQLDTGLFQSDAFFTNLFSGFHTITVKDRFGCGTAQDTFRIVNYPKFFTPNGDGYNDTWNITEIAVDQPDAYIYIFDRYGKLMKEISVQGEGWDGTFNGLSVPSTDYWFKVFYKEKGASKEFRAHFSLKR